MAFKKSLCLRVKIFLTLRVLEKKKLSKECSFWPDFVPKSSLHLLAESFLLSMMDLSRPFLQQIARSGAFNFSCSVTSNTGAKAAFVRAGARAQHSGKFDLVTRKKQN